MGGMGVGGSDDPDRALFAVLPGHAIQLVAYSDVILYALLVPCCGRVLGVVGIVSHSDKLEEFRKQCNLKYHYLRHNIG